MKVKRFFCEKSAYKNQVIIEGDEFYHFKNVMRGKTGDQVEIINGKGALYTGKITGTSKTQAFVQIQKTEKEDPLPLKIIIAPSLLKIKPMNEMIEKLSEMGIDEIRPVIYNRTDSRSSVSKKEKWNKIAQQALKVNKKLWQTNIFNPVKVEKIIALSKPIKTKLLLPVAELQNCPLILLEFIPPWFWKTAYWQNGIGKANICPGPSSPAFASSKNCICFSEIKKFR